ncbi:MAG: hypothetical protein ABEI31_06340 [Halodesulfurarchaeum sp.]
MVPADRSGEEIRIVLPEYGLIDALLGYLLFYLVVRATTPILARELSVIIEGFDASAIRFAAATLLWFILFLTVVEQVRVQLDANPRQFGTREGARTVLTEEVNPRLTTLDGGGVLLAGILVWIGYPMFVEQLQDLLATFIWVMEDRQPPPISAAGVATVVGYGLLYSIFTWFADRVVIGTFRLAIARQFSG